MISFFGERTASLWVRIALASVIGLLGSAIIIIVVVTTVTPTPNYICQVAAEPYSIYINKNGNFYVVSWYESGVSLGCDVSYHIKYYVDGEWKGEVTTKGNSYMITDLRLEWCSTLNVRIWAISETGIYSSSYIAMSHIEVPPNLLTPDMSVTKITEGLLVTWNVPEELARCDKSFRLSLFSDRGVTTSQLHIPQLIVSNDAYCFHISFTLTIMANGISVGTTSKSYRDEEDIDSVQLRISPDNQEELIVTWDNHPKEELCSIVYAVEYNTLDDAYDQSVKVTTPEARFNITYCERAIVRIITYGLNENTIGPFAYIEATQYTQIEASNAAVVFQEDKALITWERTPPIEACNVTFVVTVLTDRGDFSQNTTTTSIELSQELFCFLFGVGVQSIFGEETGDVITFDFEYGLSPVFTLELTPEESSSALIATWASHEKQEECGVQYNATFWDGALSQTNLTNQSSIAFDVLYCTTASVTVQVTSDVAMSEERVVTYYTGLPSLIGQVQNIKMEDLSNGSMRITWNPPPYVKYCNIQYKVTVEDERTCTGISSCVINLDDPCQDFQLDIIAILLDGEPVSGEPLREAYTCENDVELANIKYT